MSAKETIKYSFQCGLCGFYIYKEVWSPIVGEVLRCCYKRKNPFDRYAIAVMKQLPGRLADCTIGHLPREISQIIRFFLLRGGVVSVKIVNKNHRRSPLVQGGWKFQ